MQHLPEHYKMIIDKPVKQIKISKLPLYVVRGSVAQWLACWTSDPAVSGPIPTTAPVVIALGKQFTYISSVHPSAK